MRETVLQEKERFKERIETLRPDPKALSAFLEEFRGELLPAERPFAAYMRAKCKEKGILQQTIFLAADLSENYGYKLIAEEKHTANRDVILRICLAAHFDLEETQEALILYGMAPLYERLARDLIFLVAIRNRLWDIHQVNDLLIRCGKVPMLKEETEP